jgi:hypothetical protein
MAQSDSTGMILLVGGALVAYYGYTQGWFSSLGIGTSTISATGAALPAGVLSLGAPAAPVTVAAPVVYTAPVATPTNPPVLMREPMHLGGLGYRRAWPRAAWNYRRRTA